MSTPRYSSAEKAAILILTLGEELAADILRAMSEEELRPILQALSRLSKVAAVDVEEVTEEFLSLARQKNRGLASNPNAFGRKAIELAFKGEQATRLAESFEKTVSMRSVELGDAITLARILTQELPQTVAMVLAHAQAPKAAAIIRQLDLPLRTEIMIRMAKLEPIDPQVIAEIDQHLLQEIQRMGSINQRKIGGTKKVAEILNQLDKEGRELLSKIMERRPELGEEIRQKMFTFDDLILIDGRGMQELIKLVPRDTLVLSLRGVPDTIKNLFYRNMSERAAKLLADDIEALGPKKQSDISKAQLDILRQIQHLEEEGKLSIERQAC